MHTAMPKIVRLNAKEINKHDNVLGVDTNESEMLSDSAYVRKVRLASELLEAIIGRRSGGR